MNELLLLGIAIVLFGVFAFIAHLFDKFKASRANSRSSGDVDDNPIQYFGPLPKELEQKTFALAILRKSNGRNMSDAQARSALRIQEKMAKLESDWRSSRLVPNDRSGYVYIITNPSFRSDIVKIGMTCQVDPMDRVKSLYNTSTPLHFEPQAILYSEDALAAERALHETFRSKRVNAGREFFSVTPEEVLARAVRLKCDVLFYKSDATPKLRY